MQHFVDRQAELTTLEEQYRLAEPSFVVIYGRRRVGKTALISHFIENKPHLYFLATEESDTQNRDAFRQLVAETTSNNILANARIDSWEPLFTELAHSASQDERLIIVIDEFQYLGRTNVAFPSIFQKIWDTTLSHANVMVILCGSLVSLMTSQVLSYASPLYGRRTAQIRLGQIPFSHYCEFFDKPLTTRAAIERYSVTGGVPKYIELFRGSGSISKLIERNILDRNSFLFDEPNFLLSKEVDEVGSYFSIIKAIATGNHKLAAISSALGVKSTSLTRYLKTLEDLDLVVREVPVTERNPAKSKRGLYFIKDNYMRFWFRFVFPALGLLETGHSTAVTKRIEANFVDGLAAYTFEDVCREKLWDLGAEGRFSFLPERIGRWWGAKDVEIDAVALSEAENSLLLCECKFWKNLVGVNVLHSLEEKSKAVTWGNDHTKRLHGLFSISGFTQELQALAKERNDVILFEL